MNEKEQEYLKAAFIELTIKVQEQKEQIKSIQVEAKRNWDWFVAEQDKTKQKENN